MDEKTQGILARAILEEIKRFYEDPENQKKFEEWKEGRKENASA